ncbi:hypothetical protein GCM10009809_38930 [Isoptericola hypogeus]|uniref:DUF4192 family protein n=1 Tax=Isoptericola hypogeus TaxID=300179 RepID=A0ABP4VW28_9MICO
MPPTVLTSYAVPPQPPEPAGGSADLPAVRVRSARDLVAAVPHLLGYRPHESLVVVCVTDESVLGLVARVGLDDLAREVVEPPAGRERAVDRLVAAARRVGTTEIVAVVHTARDPRRIRRTVDPALAALELAGDVEPWIVTPEGYRGIDCSDPSCCPPRGRPLAELEHRAVNAALVLAGRAVAPSAEEAYRIVPASEARRSRAARAAARADRARAAVDAAAGALGGRSSGAAGSPPSSPSPMPARTPSSMPSSTRTDAARRASSGYDLWCDLVRHAARELRTAPPGGTDLPPARLGRLAVALAEVPVRDAVLLSTIPGADEVARRTARGAADLPGEAHARTPGDAGPGDAGPGDAGPGDEAFDVEAATARAIARIVDPRVAVRPDPGAVAAARVVLEQVVAHVPRRWHAAPLTLLGLLAWWQGDGGLAAHRLAAARAVDPAYRLAALFGGVLSAAVPPGWVRTREVARGADGGGRGLDAADPSVG